MRHPWKLCAVLSLVTATALSAQTPAASRVSGIDVSTFDKSVRPQDDLFRYVNGTWLAKNAIPADKASYGVFDLLADKAEADLRALVEEAAKSGGAPGSDARKIGDFYASFMNEAHIETLGITPLKADLAAIDHIQSKQDLARMFARLLLMGCDSPLQVFVEGDFKDPKTNALFAYQGGLGMPDRDYYLKDDAKLAEYRTKYQTLVKTLLTLVGTPTADADATAIVALEKDLATPQWSNVENRNIVKIYNKFAVADLAKEFPGFDWTAWLTELGTPNATSLIVAQPSYAKAFAAAVNDWPIDRWKPYLRASLIRGFAPYLSKAFVDARFEFYGKTLNGTPEQRPRWKRGVATVDGSLGELLGKLYVARHFPPAAKARMEQLVENLRRAYKDGIDSLEWMDAATKKEAQQKLAAFQPKVGYPSKWREYSKVVVEADDLVGNVKSANAAEMAYQLGKVGKPVDTTEWGMTPQTINAYYNPVRNEIVFPAAILQPPFFNMAADDAVNYGAIGAVIGHEMGHGFDDQGRNFDGSGTMRDWWNAADATEYKKRTDRLVAQYAGYEALPGLKLNGELTLGENIGDLTGLTMGHRAYVLALGGASAPVIDGFTGDQRFFYGWAQVWRGATREDALRQQVLTNPHPPEEFRANGAVGNVPEFYATFDVKPGDKMFIAPEKRTKIW
jgi:putative endopeptidase